MELPNQNSNDSRSGSTEDFRIVPNEYLFSKDCCYQVQAFLGEGTFGQVAKCIEMDSNKKVAIKIIKKKHHYTVLTEVDVLKVLSAEDTEKNNFVKWHEWFNYRGHTCLVFELLDMSLFDFMKHSQFSPMAVRNIRTILQQVATALNKLQSMGLMHTDLKPENIALVDQVREPFRVKLIDFGLASHESNVRRGMHFQTRWYRAPEVILGLPLSHAIDVWSLGCVAAGLLMGYPMYPADSEYELMRFITQTQGQLPDKILSDGLKTGAFFVEGSDWSYTLWRLKTPEEFEDETNYRPRETRRYILNSLDQLEKFKLPPNPELTEVQNRKDFVDLVQKMLHLEEGKRLTARQVLEHPFIVTKSISDSTNFLWTQSMYKREHYIPTEAVAHTTKRPLLYEQASPMVPRQVQPSTPVQALHVGQCDLEEPNKRALVTSNSTKVKDSEDEFTLSQGVRDFEDLTTVPSLVEERETLSTTSLIKDTKETQDLTTVPSLLVKREIQSKSCPNQEVEPLIIMEIKEVQHTEVDVQKVQEVEATPSLMQVTEDRVSGAAKASSSPEEEAETPFLSLAVRGTEIVEASSPKTLPLQETGALLTQEESASLNLFQEVEETEALTHLLEDEAVDIETPKCLQVNMDIEASSNVSQETKVPPTPVQEPKSPSHMPEQVQKLKTKTSCPLSHPKKWKICRCLSRLWRLIKPRKNKKSEVAND